MSGIEKSVIRTEAIFSDDKQHRYALKKEWDKNKKKAMVMMINPSSADELMIDHTTMYTVNNLYKLDFGSVEMVNIFSKINIRINMKEGVEELVGSENDNYILKSAAKVDAIIIAWGKIGENNKKVQKRQKEVLEMLEPYKEKLYIIQDESGREGFHPLAPQIRFRWKLKKLELETQENKQIGK
jgi:hypothetical protein